MITNIQTHTLFATPLTISQIELNDIENIINSLLKLEYNKIINTPLDEKINPHDYKMSVDHNILLQPFLENINDQILISVDNYINNVMKYANKKFKIVKSWSVVANGKYAGQPPIHWHTNSIVTGVLTLFNSDEKYSKLELNNGVKNTPFYKFDVKESNCFNTSQYFLPQTPGVLYLFPSDLLHTFTPLTVDGSRINIAFDVGIA